MTKLAQMMKRWPVGTMVERNGLGLKLMPRSAGRVGEIVGYHKDIDVMILWEGEPKPVLNHSIYLKRVAQ